MSLTKVTNRVIEQNSISLDKLTQNEGSFTFRNKIINGGFDIWQRGTAFNYLTFGSKLYTADRWACSQNNNTPRGYIELRDDGEVILGPGTPSIGTQTYLRFGRYSNAAIDTMTLFQGIEYLNAKVLQGKTVTLSYWARRGNTASPDQFGIRVSGGSGVNENPNLMWGGGFAAFDNAFYQPSQPLTTTWTRYSHTFFITRANTIGVGFQIIPNGVANANNYVDLKNIQLEEGTFATPYEIRDIGTEVASCQRYFIATPCLRSDWGNSAGYAMFEYYFPVTMRRVPDADFTQSGCASPAGSYYTPPEISVTRIQRQIAGVSGGNTFVARVNLDAEL
jgi:hypothetical protein